MRRLAITLCRRGIKTVTRKEFTGSAFSNNITVKEQSASVSVLGTKRYVVAYHQNGNTLFCQFVNNTRKGYFKFCIKTLCRLIQKKNIGCSQENFCKGGSLLFTARNIIRVTVEKFPRPQKPLHMHPHYLFLLWILQMQSQKLYVRNVQGQMKMVA